MSKLTEALERLNFVVNELSEASGGHFQKDNLRDRMYALTSLREIFDVVKKKLGIAMLVDHPRSDKNGASVSFVLKQEFSEPGDAATEVRRLLSVQFGIKTPHMKKYPNPKGADIFYTGGTYNGLNVEVMEEFVFGDDPVVIISLGFRK